MTMPALFIAHGSPMLALEESAYTAFLRRLGQRLSCPKAVAIFSAHWDEPHQAVTGDDVHKALHDYYGFPEASYQIDYSPLGSSELTDQIQQLFTAGNLKCRVVRQRGLDHGSWVVLRAMYPEADIPVVELSIDTKRSPKEQYAIGQMLAPLREQDVLVIGSGGLIHNPRLARDAEAADRARQFESWMAERLDTWKLSDLFQYDKKAPNARHAVPSYGPAHLSPLFYAMGAADTDPQAHRLYQDYQTEGVSLDCWQFGGEDLNLLEASSGSMK